MLNICKNIYIYICIDPYAHAVIHKEKTTLRNDYFLLKVKNVEFTRNFLKQKLNKNFIKKNYIFFLFLFFFTLKT